MLLNPEQVRKLEKAGPSIHASVDREELLSRKLTLLAFVLLAMSLFLSMDSATLIEGQLSGHVLPDLGFNNVSANRPIGTCMPAGSIPKMRHGGGNCPFNFVLSLSQGNLTQVRGSTNLNQLSVNLISGVSIPVSVSAQAVPPGATILFAPANGKPSFSSIITVATSPETPIGQFNITILATGGGLEKSAILSLTVVPIVHELAILSATVQGTAAVGSIVLINATVANYGSVFDSFELRAYANASLLAEQSTLSLAPSAIYTGRLAWNTTGFSPGTYTVLVTVPLVQGELNSIDNTREAGKILLNQTPGSTPNPSPAASGGVQGSNFGRQLAIVAATAEVAVIFLVVLRSRRRVQPETRR